MEKSVSISYPPSPSEHLIQEHSPQNPSFVIKNSFLVHAGRVNKEVTSISWLFYKLMGICQQGALFATYIWCSNMRIFKSVLLLDLAGCKERARRRLYPKQGKAEELLSEQRDDALVVQGQPNDLLKSWDLFLLKIWKI